MAADLSHLHRLFPAVLDSRHAAEGSGVKPPDPEKVAQLQERATRLGELRAHPSWAELCEVVAEKKAARFEQLRKNLLSGEPVDQRYIDRLAGFFMGAEFVLERPDLAEASLATALKKAELFEALNEEVTR